MPLALRSWISLTHTVLISSEQHAGLHLVIGPPGWGHSDKADALLDLSLSASYPGRRGSVRGWVWHPLALQGSIESIWEPLGAFWEPSGASVSLTGASGSLWKPSEASSNVPGALWDPFGTFWKLFEFPKLVIE